MQIKILCLNNSVVGHFQSGMRLKKKIWLKNTRHIKDEREVDR